MRISRSAKRIAAAVVLGAIPFATTGADWPTYLQSPQRTSASGETILTTANAPSLHKVWSHGTGGIMSASATIVNNIVYVGSWDGYEYAFDASSGLQRWRTYLGIDTSLGSCGGSRGRGIASTATVQNGVVYVGGGDSYWYALSASSGRVLWKVMVGDNATGHFNWSSPLVVNGHAYVGIASLGDCPLVQGQVLDILLGSHAIAHTFNVVPTGQTGGTVWSSPAAGPSLSALFVTTGNEAREPATVQPQARAEIMWKHLELLN
ncbi:MAG: PQQ-binding-like beta-propeller repeat protein [Chloroflexota bacterium]|nr:MAG: hypothetical protein DLM70_07875 [Chloroflexota bacterium]